jgi:hypothetical protein
MRSEQNIKEYDRAAAAAYAEQWAMTRNPRYYNFDGVGGDCTNFASQCVFAGAGVMNRPNWYYTNAADRSPSWTGVPFLYNFLLTNKGKGPFGTARAPEETETGDLIQLCDENGRHYHSLIVVGLDGSERYIAAHTYDAYRRALSSYTFAKALGAHIEGARLA